VFALAALTVNEVEGHERGNPIQSAAMDMHNNLLGANLLGVRLGAQARTFADVVRLAQAAVRDAITSGGSDTGGAIWRDRQFWKDERERRVGDLADWEPPGPQTNEYAFASAAFRYLGDAPNPRQAEKELLERLADTPVADWSYEDVLGVIRSRPYSSSANASRPAWHARVREWFRLRESERDSANIAERVGPKADAAECGGTAQVRAHTRNTAHGPVQVAAHTRTVTCGR